MIVNEVTARVFVGAERRYFKKDAAYMSFAWKALKQKYEEFCDCDSGDPSVGLSPSFCRFHSDREKFRRIASRYSLRLKNKDQAEKQEAKP